jgi:septum site-determining protein MinC
MGILMIDDNSLKIQAFKLKGRLYTLTVLHLLGTDKDAFEQQLIETIATAPRLFDRTPVVLDCSAVDSDCLDLSAFCQCMRLHAIVPVGIQGCNALLATIAQVMGLAVLHASSTHDKSLMQDIPEILTTKQPDETIKTKILTMPVRSGQQVVSKGGDLVITAAVSHGAELLADGHIHVYGALRGRALAGIAGDKDARIFCQSLDAELVSIAGLYCLRDAIEPIAGPCQIFLLDDRIHIEAI